MWMGTKPWKLLIWIKSSGLLLGSDLGKHSYSEYYLIISLSTVLLVLLDLECAFLLSLPGVHRFRHPLLKILSIVQQQNNHYQVRFIPYSLHFINIVLGQALRTTAAVAFYIKLNTEELKYKTTGESFLHKARLDNSKVSTFV